MTRILIIGKYGQVATALRQYPAPQGWQVTAVGRDLLDLTDIRCIAATVDRFEPDLIVNAAAFTAVDKAENQRRQADLVNHLSVAELAAFAASRGVRLLQLSTDYVFDGSQQTPWAEHDEPAPLNAYGQTKLAGERAIQDSGADAIIVRTSGVFSSNGNNFVTTILHLADTRDELTVVADQIGGPTAARDISGCLFDLAGRMLESDRQTGTSIYHYCGAPPVSWADFAEAIIERASWLRRPPAVRRIKSADYPAAVRRPLNSVLDCSMLQRDFGIRQPDWRSSLDQVMQHLGPNQVRGRAL